MRLQLQYHIVASSFTQMLLFQPTLLSENVDGHDKQTSFFWEYALIFVEHRRGGMRGRGLGKGPPLLQSEASVRQVGCTKGGGQSCDGEQQQTWLARKPTLWFGGKVLLLRCGDRVASQRPVCTIFSPSMTPPPPPISTSGPLV